MTCSTTSGRNVVCSDRFESRCFHDLCVNPIQSFNVMYKSVALHRSFSGGDRHNE